MLGSASVFQINRYLERMLDAMSMLTMKKDCRVKGQDQGVSPPSV
jgi:hypothetical protein